MRFALRTIVALAALAALSTLRQPPVLCATPASPWSVRAEATQPVWGSLSLDDTAGASGEAPGGVTGASRQALDAARVAATARAEWAAWEAVSTLLGVLPGVGDRVAAPLDRLALAIGLAEREPVAETPAFDGSRVAIRAAATRHLNPEGIARRATDLRSDREHWERLRGFAARGAELMARLDAWNRQQAEPTSAAWLGAADSGAGLMQELNAHLSYGRGLSLWDARARTFTPARAAWADFTRCIAFDPGYAQAYLDRLRIPFSPDNASPADLAAAAPGTDESYRALDLPQRLSSAYASRKGSSQRFGFYVTPRRSVLMWSGSPAVTPYVDDFWRINAPGSYGYVPRGVGLRGFGPGVQAVGELSRACASGVREACEALRPGPLR